MPLVVCQVPYIQPTPGTAGYPTLEKTENKHRWNIHLNTRLQVRIATFSQENSQLCS